MNQTSDQTTETLNNNKDNKEVLNKSVNKTWKWLFLTAGFAIAGLLFIKKYLKK